MIQRLLLLNGLAALGVVLNHAAGWGFVAMFWWTDRYRDVTVPNFDQMYSAPYWTLRLIEQLIIVSIPAFLFVSGYFIAIATGRTKSRPDASLLSKRILAFLTPFVLWSIVMFVSSAIQGITFTPSGYVRLLLTGRATQAYYYVPLVIQMYALSIILAPLARKKWLSLLLFFLILQLVVMGLRYLQILGVNNELTESLKWLMPAWFFPGHGFWFVLGLVVGFHLQGFKRTIHSLRWPLLGTAIFMIPLGMLEWEILLRASGQDWIAPTRVLSDEIYSIAFIMAFLAFSRVSLPFSKHLQQLGIRSYGIFLIHTLILLWTAKIVYHFAPRILEYQILFQPLLIVLGIGIPLVMMKILNHSFARRYYKYIFG